MGSSSNQYVATKAESTARAVSKAVDVDFGVALHITTRIWEEARRCILRVASTEDWQKLSFSDKARVCSEVVKVLLDREKVAGFVLGKTGRIL